MGKSTFFALSLLSRPSSCIIARLWNVSLFLKRIMERHVLRPICCSSCFGEAALALHHRLVSPSHHHHPHRHSRRHRLLPRYDRRCYRKMSCRTRDERSPKWLPRQTSQTYGRCDLATKGWDRRTRIVSFCRCCSRRSMALLQ